MAEKELGSGKDIMAEEVGEALKKDDTNPCILSHEELHKKLDAGERKGRGLIKVY